MFARGFKTWCENTAVSLRADLGLGPAVPLSPLDLATKLGVRVWQAADVPGIDEQTLRVLLKEDPDSWSAVTIALGRERLVLLNSSHSPARAASDLAHELSHIVLGHEPARVDVSEDGLLMLHSFDRAQEDEANWLAGCLLLPRAALLEIRKSALAPAAAVRQFGVSVDMLQYRINVTGVNVQMARRQGSRQPGQKMG